MKKSSRNRYVSFLVSLGLVLFLGIVLVTDGVEAYEVSIIEGDNIYGETLISPDGGVDRRVEKTITMNLMRNNGQLLAVYSYRVIGYYSIVAPYGASITSIQPIYHYYVDTEMANSASYSYGGQYATISQDFSRARLIRNNTFFISLNGVISHVNSWGSPY